MKKVRTTNHWVSLALAGASIAAFARLTYIATILLISLPMGETKGFTGSFSWMVVTLTNILGWIPYLFWGSVAGLSTICGRWWILYGLLLCSLFCLWTNEILWYHGGQYRVSFDLERLINLSRAAFWQEAGILAAVWLLPHTIAFLLMPKWADILANKISQALFGR